MKKYLLIFVGLILAACAEDCSECERKLKLCAFSEPIPLDLPKPESTGDEPDQKVLKVAVNAEDAYVFEGSEYTFDVLSELLLTEIYAEDPAVEKLKIEGDKMAHYAAIFNLIAFAKDHQLSPILVYDGE